MTAMILRLFSIAAVLLLLVASYTVVGDVDEEEKRRAIRLKTVGQLKKIFAELEINYQVNVVRMINHHFTLSIFSFSLYCCGYRNA